MLRVSFVVISILLRNITVWIYTAESEVNYNADALHKAQEHLALNSIGD